MNIIDRYITKKFLLTFVFGMVALCAIFMVVNLMETLDDFIDKDVSTEVIINYYIYFLPEILKLLTPIGILIAVLFSVGMLSTGNEITAMKTGGMSLFRLMIPFIIIGISLSGLQLYFNGWIVPIANAEKIAIEQQYLKQKKSGGPIYNLYFRESPTRNIIMQYYDGQRKTGNRIAVEEFSSEETPRLVHRIEAKKILWDSVSVSWKLINGIERKYIGIKNEVSRFDTTFIKLSITHDQIIKLKISISEMNFDELRDYIQMMKSGGKDVRKQMIEYYGNYAFPFANIIVILFGVPFASVRKKNGIAVQIGAAMGISFVYLVFTKLSQTVGLATDISPQLTAWSANAVFLAFGLITIFRTKT